MYPNLIEISGTRMYSTLLNAVNFSSNQELLNKNKYQDLFPIEKNIILILNEECHWIYRHPKCLKYFK